MLQQFNFHLTQCEYVRAVMLQIPAYRPDQATPSVVDSMINNAKTVRGDYLAKWNFLAIKRGTKSVALSVVHEACVSVYACLKPCYRKDPPSLHAIELLPVQDQSESETLTRALDISKCWAALPNPPGWATPFKVGALDLAAFDLLPAAFEASVRAEVEAEKVFQLREGFLNGQEDFLRDFATAALAQGRGLFKPGTPERGLIDRIPIAPAAQPPSQAQITLAESAAAGEAHLQFAAEHATSFEVWRQGPGEDQFAKVGESLVPGDYVATGLAAGEYKFKIVGVNSRGEGEASTITTVQVAAAQAA